MPDLKTAIHQASLAIREDGKPGSHQCRVGRVALGRFEAALQQPAASATCRSGSGPTSQRVDRLVHDTAIRIGWRLGLETEFVCVHAGAARGAWELDLTINGGNVQQRDWPPKPQRFTADEVEGRLCIYKSRVGERVARSVPCLRTAPMGRPCL